MAEIIDGKKLANKIIENLKDNTSALLKKPGLAVIMAGDNPASKIYVGNKQKKAQYIGFESKLIAFSKDVTEEDLIKQISILNENDKINAILVQLPLPCGINQQKIIENIKPEKDVDGFTSCNFGKLALGYTPYAYPCTPKGIIRLLEEYKINIEGRHAVVIGRSNIVGKPVSILLQQKNATVTMANSHTVNLKELACSADIVISAIGKPRFLNADFIKKGAVVIDVGINRTDTGIAGDFDAESIIQKASYMTPVPGGVGPMTIAMLMENTLELYKIQQCHG